MTKLTKNKTKRSYKKKTRSKKATPIGGFRTSELVKLKYAQEVLLVGSSGGIVQHQFRCNSVYDPDYTTTGHQPMNFDQWAGLYDHYTVMSSKLKVTPVDGQSANVAPGYMGCMVSTDSGGTSALANVTSLFENKLTSHKFMQVGNNAGLSRSWLASGVKSSFNAKRVFGVKDPQDGAAYGSSISDNPSKDAYFNVYLAAVEGNTPSSISCLVEIEYIVLFDELITQTQN